MSNANDPKKVLTFGQNVQICTILVGRTLGKLASDASVELSILKGYINGEGTLTQATVSNLADEFGLPFLQLLGSHGDWDERIIALRTLLEQYGTDKALDTEEVAAKLEKLRPVTKSGVRISALEAKYVRPHQVAGGAVSGLEKAQPEISREEDISGPVKVLTKASTLTTKSPTATEIVAAPVEILAAVTKPEKVTPPKTLSPMVRESNPVPVKTPELATETALKVVPKEPAVCKKTKVTPATPEIIWDKSGTVATCGDLVLDLDDRNLKIAIGKRLRYAKGSLAFTEVATRVRPGKSSGWVNSLSNGCGSLCKSDLEKLGKVCKVSVESLLMGTGIIELSASETASSWMNRFAEAGPDGKKLRRELRKVARSLKDQPKATQVMAAAFLSELVE